jgi:8-oxo-dGTP pyrophosphatase MutT (NUDIX family)
LWRHDGKQKFLHPFAVGTAGVSLLEQLRCRLLQHPPQLSSHDDYDFAPEPVPAALGALKAAVLLPILAGKEPRLLFTRRTEGLAQHSGQVSFPGGRSEDGDLSAVETALRETFEEIGIAPGYVTVAGYLDRYLTGTGFDIQPVVGMLTGGFTLAPDPREVAHVFEVPLAFLLDPANRRREEREIGGRLRRFYAFRYEGHEIWGATAAIVVNLADRLGEIGTAHAD